MCLVPGEGGPGNESTEVRGVHNYEATHVDAWPVGTQPGSDSVGRARHTTNLIREVRLTP